MKTLAILGLVFFYGLCLQAQVAVPDSVKKDTIEKIIVPKTLQYDAEKMFQQQGYQSSIVPNPDRLLYQDELEALKGFSNSLGMIGHPYRRYLNGVNANWFREGIWQDPLSRQEDVYTLNPESGAKFFDSRTPSVNFLFYQHNGGTEGKMNRVAVDATQNIVHWRTLALEFNAFIFRNFI